MALGAERRNVAGLIVREALLLAAIGLGIGAGGAIWVGYAMKSTLYSVRSFDASVIGAVSVLLLATALIAAYLPARRAASVDPMQALRIE